MKEPGTIEMYTRNAELVEKIKGTIREMLSLDERPRENYSVYISNELQLNYTYLANVFSATCGSTIERYIIETKIDKAIELLKSGYTVREVTASLWYSSMGHFSNQFKKVTGVNPSVYWKINIAMQGNTTEGP
jgi:YesN/AraC family two-component response regulator